MTDAKLKRRYKSNQVIVNNKSNFKSHLVRCQLVMDDIKFDELVIMGIGKATNRALRLALQLNLNNMNTFELVPRTYSIEKLEDRPRYKRPLKGTEKRTFNPDDLELETVKKLIYIPAIEIRVIKDKMEREMIQRLRNELSNS